MTTKEKGGEKENEPTSALTPKVILQFETFGHAVAQVCGNRYKIERPGTPKSTPINAVAVCKNKS
jgi:hypothetical protein